MSPWTGGGEGSGPDPLNLKDKLNTPRTWPRVFGQGQVQGLGPSVFGVKPLVTPSRGARWRIYLCMYIYIYVYFY